jgi:hypothetical protein
MGCDIHLTVEKHTLPAGQSWANSCVTHWEAVFVPFNQADNDFSIKYYTENPEFLQEQDALFREKFRSGQVPLSWEHRNYTLFGILAGVRSIELPMAKGVTAGTPKDASVYHRARVKRWKADGHSHHHITLDKLLAYDWNQTLVCDMLLTRDGAVDYIQTQRFNQAQVCLDSCDAESVSLDTFHERLAAVDQIRSLPEAIGAISLVIPVPAWYIVRDFHHGFLQKLRELDQDPKKARLCYFFDN